jgi:hypothetical protein
VATVTALDTIGAELEDTYNRQRPIIKRIEAEVEGRLDRSGLLVVGQQGGSIHPVNDLPKLLNIALNIQPFIYSLLPQDSRYVLAAKLLVNLYRWRRTNDIKIITDINKDIEALKGIENNFLNVFLLDYPTINANLGIFIYTITNFLATSTSVDIVKNAFSLSEPTSNTYTTVLLKGIEIYSTIMRMSTSYTQKIMIKICDPYASRNEFRRNNWDKLSKIYTQYCLKQSVGINLGFSESQIRRLGSLDLPLMDLFATVIPETFPRKLLVEMCENMVRFMIILVFLYENYYSKDTSNIPLYVRFFKFILLLVIKNLNIIIHE